MHVLMETYKIIHFGASEKLKNKLVPKSVHSKSLQVPKLTRLCSLLIIVCYNYVISQGLILIMNDIKVRAIYCKYCEEVLRYLRSR